MRSRKVPITCAAIGPTSTASARGLNSLDSMRDRSSTSSTSSCRRRALRSIISTKRTDASGSRSADRRSVSAADATAAIGVRSSCETLATKSRRSDSSRRTSVTSTKTASRPGLPRHRLGVHQRAPRLEARRSRSRPSASPPTPAPSPAAAAARRCGSPRSRCGPPPRSTAPASRAATGSPAGCGARASITSTPSCIDSRMRPSRSRSARMVLSVADRLSASASSALPRSATSSWPRRCVRTSRSPDDILRAASVSSRSDRDRRCAAPNDRNSATPSAMSAPNAEDLPQALRWHRRRSVSGTARRAISATLAVALDRHRDVHQAPAHRRAPAHARSRRARQRAPAPRDDRGGSPDDRARRGRPRSRRARRRRGG